MAKYKVEKSYFFPTESDGNLLMPTTESRIAQFMSTLTSAMDVIELEDENGNVTECKSEEDLRKALGL